MTRSATILLALLTLCPMLGTAPAGAVLPPSPEAQYQHQAFTATNNARHHHNRAALHSQDCVQKFAVMQARKMANQDRMFHQELGPIMRECHLSAAGENVAFGYPSGRSAVKDGWMHSAGHRANILNRYFRLLGIGARRSADGTWYASQVFGRKAG
jgi:uncharacterized protein YkwD